MEQSATLPGTGSDERPSVICHVDMDCFYAACERLREPALEGEPLVVGMGYEAEEPHGAVATASYEAREYGVESAMTISEALEKLPRKVDAATDPDLDVADAGFYRPVDMDYYESVAADVREILRGRADVIREVSIDEAYLDVSDRVGWEDDVAGFAADLKVEVVEAVGVTPSVGVAPTMSAAKIASDHDKPDGLVVIEPGEVQSFLAPLDVEDVHGVGPVTAAEFRELGIETAGDLAAADPNVLEERFGERGVAVHRYARGEDDRDVEPVGKPKSLSRESAFADPTNDESLMRERVSALATSVAERAERKEALYRTIGIKAVEPPFDVNTRAHSLPGPVQDADLVEEVALDLLEEFEDERVRKLGVRVSNLDFSGEDQASLGDWQGLGAAGGDTTDHAGSVDDVTDQEPAVDGGGTGTASTGSRGADTAAESGVDSAASGTATMSSEDVASGLDDVDRPKRGQLTLLDFL
jgi:DNA polymerase IV (DinB-like DNA polymerase)